MSTELGAILKGTADTNTLTEIASGFERGPSKLLYDDGVFFLQTPHNIYASENEVDWKNIYTTADEIHRLKKINGQFALCTDNGIKLFTVEKSLKGQIDELNSALLNKQSYPDYSKISTIISGGVGTKTYTCTENGFVQFVGASGNNSVKPEIDLSINGVYVYKFRTGYQTTYVKATSGLFPVKQGDVIKCVIQSSFVADESVRFYQLRY